VGFVEGETGYCSETCVTGGVGGTGEGCVKVEDAIDIKEEVSIEVEDAVDIKEEVSIEAEDTVDIKDELAINFKAVYIKDAIPEAIKSLPIKTELEVSLWGVSGVVAVHDFRPFICHKTEFMKLNLTIFCSVLYCLFNIPVQIWITVLKARDFWCS
jgi:hypothetical protein